MLSAIVLAVAIGAILGDQFAPNKSLATLPIAMLVVGTAITSIPASAIMRWRGVAAPVSCSAPRSASPAARCAPWQFIANRSLPLPSGICCSVPTKDSPATTALPPSKPPTPAAGSTAISLVVAGGIVAAFLGPQLALWGRDWVTAQPFVGSYLAQGILSVVGLLLLTRLKLPKRAAAAGGAARPLRTILAQPASRVAILGAAVGGAVIR